MKKGIILAFLWAMFVTFSSLAQTNTPIRKSNLTILYVGGSSDLEPSLLKDTMGLAKSIQQRMSAFEKMLKEYFQSVTVVHADTYTPSLSGRYDVTVMDGKPKPIREGVMEQDSSGRMIKSIPADYFTEDFDRPMVTIGELGEVLGRSIGTKIDWYCLCLEGDALGFRKEHPIFKGPFPVQMTVAEKPTPELAIYAATGPLPAKVAMWQVQTKSNSTDRNFRIGLIARGWGFEDSPEAEFISGGVSSKALDAVAIGRHGNFLHWGFAASPDYLTEEAKTVLANAVVYMAQFAGKGMIARKYDPRIPTRDYLQELKYNLTPKSYEVLRDLQVKLNESWAEIKKRALAKKEKGELLTRAEQTSLGVKPKPVPTFEDHLKRFQKELFPLFENNVAKYTKYYDENRNYFYGTGAYHLAIDKDVKSLGIPINDKKLLDKCITLLEKKQAIDKASRILDRYTLVSFTTPAEWRGWYEANKKRIFFTESGGYRFLINTYDRAVEGNDYKKKENEHLYSQVKTSGTDHKNPVSVAAGIVEKGNHKKEVVIRFKIHPGYHLYASVTDQDPFVQTAVNIDLPKGYTKTGNLKEPPSRIYNSSGTTVYSDEILFVQEIAGQGAGDITCLVSYQCCDEQICFPPVYNKAYRISAQSPAANDENEKLRLAVEANPNDLKLHQAYIKALKYDSPELLQQYDEWIKKYPASAMFAYAIGNTLSNRELPAGKIYLLKAIEMDPKFDKAYYALSGDAEKRGEFDASFNYLKKAGELDPANADYAFGFANTQQIRSDEAKYKELCLKIAKDFPGSFRGAQALFWLAYRTEDPREKIMIFEQQKRDFPAEKYDFTMFGMDEYYNLLLPKDPQKALTLADEIAPLVAKDNASRKQQWESNMALARTVIQINSLLAKGKKEEAVTALEKLSPPGRGPSKEFFTFYRSKVLDEAGNTAAAYKNILLAYAKEPILKMYPLLLQYGKKLGKDPKQVEVDYRYIMDTASRMAPDFKLENYYTKTPVASSDYKDKVVLLTYWFPGCGPCRGEFPHFENVVRKFKDRNDFVYVGINIVPQQDAYVLPFMKSSGYSFIPLKDNDQWQKGDMDHRGLAPMNFLIDKNGRIMFSAFRTDQHNEETLERMIRSLLERNPA